jgi:hypothetical protein
MNEWTRKSYENFAVALWEATLDQTHRRQVAVPRETEIALKAMALAWKEAAAPEVNSNIKTTGFYEKKPLDLSRFKP